MKLNAGFLLIAIILVNSITLTSCSKSEKSDENKTAETGTPLFTLLPAEKTKVDFANTLTEGLNTNVLM
jgi:hypothetical protein